MTFTSKAQSTVTIRVSYGPFLKEILLLGLRQERTCPYLSGKKRRNSARRNLEYTIKLRFAPLHCINGQDKAGEEIYLER